MPGPNARHIKLILLNFLKKNCAQKTAEFPHFDQTGKTGGSYFSPCLFASLSGWKFLLVLSGFIFSISANANVQQQIDQAIHQHLQAMMNKTANENGWKGMRLALENTPLTSINQLTPCLTTIKVSGGSRSKLSRQQLTLECTSNQPTKGWPIKTSTNMQIFLPVIISTSVINRGETIRSNQLQQQETDITRAIRGFYHHSGKVTGMSAKRRIRANQILSPDLIDQPQLVKRNEKVKIIANRDGITASMPGEALEKGSEGEVIKVRNLSSGKTIKVKVVEVGVVTSTF